MITLGGSPGEIIGFRIIACNGFKVFPNSVAVAGDKQIDIITVVPMGAGKINHRIDTDALYHGIPLSFFSFTHT